MSLNAGAVVGERYRVVRLLGQGGMGAVYRAWDIRLNRPVALKEMIPQPGLDAQMLDQLKHQFQQEAQILASLAHPGLVRVTDHFSWHNNAYLVMDFIEGESLADRIDQQGAQPEDRVLGWAAQLLDALSYCHAHGVLHRDVKPQNIIITPEGSALLVDFGLVKLWDPTDPQTRTVMRGSGTPEYAPPEQYDIGASHTDPRSDVYAVGATLYHALTGQMPPTATQRMASPTSFVPPRRIRANVSPATEAAVLKALEIAMEDRFQSADEMAQALTEAGEPVLVTPPHAAPQARPAVPPFERPSSKKRKKGLVLGLGGMGVTIIGVICLAIVAGAILMGLYLVDGESEDGDIVSPTAMMPPTNTPQSQVEEALFRDDFDSPATGWEVGGYETGSVGYKNGVYFVTSLSDGSTMWGVSNRTFDDLVIEVDVTQVAAGPESNNDFGVVCREQGDGNGYFMLISGDGFASIVKAEEGEFEWLADWSESSAIQQGNKTNHLRAVCDGPSLALYVNGQQVASAQDSTFTAGDIAFTATTYEDELTEIHFDNLVVWAP